jgi:hypothetical protein
MARSDKVSSLQANGLVPAALFDDAYGAADAGCGEIATALRRALVKSCSERSAEVLGLEVAGPASQPMAI